MTSEQPWGPPTAHTTVPVGVPAEPTLAELAPMQAPKRPMRRLLAGAGVVAVLAVGVGAFVATRSDNSRSTTAFALAKVADNTFAERTARVTMTMALPLGPNDGSEATVDGIVDLDHMSSSFTMDLTPALEAVGEDVPPGGGNVEMIQSGLVTYMRGAVFSEIPGIGDKWLKMDLASMTKSQGVDIGQVATQSNNNPSDQLAMLRNAGDVTEVGTETIRGAETTRYHATIDLEKVYRDKGAVTNEALFRKMLDQLGTTQIPLEVWVDGDGRARKLEMTMSVSGKDLRMVVEYYDFGVKADFTVPADSDTVDFMKALGG